MSSISKSQNQSIQKSKRLCFVSSTLSNGGAERALSNLLCNMDLTHLEVTVLLLNGVVTYPVPSSVKIVDLRKRSPFHIPLCFILLMYHLLKLKPKIVISVWSFPSLLTGLAMFFTRSKSIWIPRIANNPADEEFGWKKWVFNWLYKKADRFIVLCNELRDNFVDHYPFSSGKTNLIRNGFNLRELNEKASQLSPDISIPNEPFMISVGSLTDQKRHDVLLKAYAQLPESDQIPLLILGGGPLHDNLTALANELGINNKVHFKGFVTNPYPYVKHAKLFVLASDFEGLCNAAIEAQCLGTPAVITSCPTGNREIVVEGQTGFLVPIGDPQKMAQSISKALNQKTISSQMRIDSERLVSEKYKIQRSVADMHSLIEEIC
ncbi:MULTISPECIES: glycosyltransferase [Alteromonadaceae]|uniref:glycosyltransferase n=1 Tax=Alteromonadaceae TaxID=72275 RepID=UPI003106D741